MPGATLVDESLNRVGEWQAALEPDGGASFDIYIQNPYSQAAEPDLYLRRVRVSRVCRDGGPGALRLGPLDPLNPASPVVFGDDEVYVANYQNRQPYDFERPYYYPADDSDFLCRNRPPSRASTFVGALGDCMADGCFHALKRHPVVADPPARLLRRRSTPLAAPDFGVAMTYAVARRTLDIWKGYFAWQEGIAAAVARPLSWWFGAHLPRLEIVPFIDDDPADIAVSGFGYVQLGSGPDSHHAADLFDVATTGPDGEPPGSTPYWLNADVLAHEIGHHLLYTTLGFGPAVDPTGLGPDWFGLWAAGSPAPADPMETGDPFRAFHEAFSDIVAVVVSLHDARFLEAVLAETGGDIFTANAATSVGEVSARKTIRNTFNNVRLADVRPRAPGDPPAKRYYQMSQVISGALFDIMAGFAARYLDAHEALPGGVVAGWEAGDTPPPNPAAPPGRRPVEADLLAPADRAREATLRGEITRLYAEPDGPAVVAAALIRARDGLGRLLGAYLAGQDPRTFEPAAFTLAGLRDDLATVAAGQPSTVLDGAAKATIVRSCFAWRGI